MKVLLDNCMVVRLTHLLSKHSVSTCRDLGWRDYSNGILLKAANEAGFEVLITVDKKMRFQSSLKGLEIAVVVIDADANSRSQIAKALAELDSLLESYQPGLFHVFQLAEQVEE